MTDYTDPLGKWVEENISRFTEKIAVDNRPFPIIDSLAMLRAYVAESDKEDASDYFDLLRRAETAEAELAEARRDSARLRTMLVSIRSQVLVLRNRLNEEQLHATEVVAEMAISAIDAAMTEAQPKEPA